jgi:hypothetical protein
MQGQVVFTTFESMNFIPPTLPKGIYWMEAKVKNGDRFALKICLGE